MSVYPVSEPYSSCPPLVDSTFGLYLGALINNPITTVVGTYYWNTALSIFRVWSNGVWNDVNPIQFNGIVNGGSVSKINSIEIRRDTSTNWSIANPILLLGEVGLETDTLYLKFGNGSSTWNLLQYQTIPSTRVTGFENVNNTSDINKPVSTSQSIADALILTTANTYTDTSMIGVFIDKGSYVSQITGLFPTGAILKGYTYEISDTGLLGTISVKPKDTIRALIDAPGQTESNWLFQPVLTNVITPYIVSVYIPGSPIADATVMYHDVVVPMYIPSSATGSLAKCKTKSGTTCIFYIKKNSIQVGTITFNSGSFVGTYSFTSLVNFNVGDVLEITCPNPADSIISDISISLYGIR